MSSPAPPAEPDSLRRAEDLVRQGDLAGAETAFREVLSQRPEHARARHMLGLIAQRRGQLKEALRHLKAAVEAEPGNAEIRSHLGEAHRAFGDAAAAVRAGREAVRLAPEWPPGLNNLGLALQAEGELDEAESVFRRLTEIAPGYPRGHYNLGNLLNQRERPEEAESSLRRALELKPAYPQAWNALGAVTAHLGRPDEAERAYRQAIELAPRYAKALYNLGNLLADQQRPDEALRCFDDALRIDPAYREALLARGSLLADRHRFEEALQSYDQALQSDPAYREAMLAKGSLLAGRNESYEQGLGILEETSRRYPQDYRVPLALGEAHFTCFDFAAAAMAYRRSLDIEPDQPEATANLILCRAEICDWTDRERDFARLRELLDRQLSAGKPSPLSPHGSVFFPLTPNEQLAIARRRAEGVSESVAAAARQLGPPPEPEAGDRLRIGYLSSDFRENALAHLTAGVYGLHDRQHFEVYGYSLGPDDGSPYRQRIAADCDHFADLRQATDIEVARRIRDDGIHILVDLVGFAGGARPGIPALRPAPAQVIWLYPGSMGGVCHDYMIGDPVATPAERTGEFGERLVLMPDTYQVTDHEQPLPERAGHRADHGLPEGAFVFSSFNAHAKIDPGVFDIWMRLLDAAPGSVLWLLALSKAGRENLRHEAKSRGIDPGRLVFGAHAPRPLHLERLTLADLALDTLVCNGHTTTSDALWAGLPVVTCPGETFPSRVSESLLQASGMQELVAKDLAGYEDLALSLARDPERLQSVRQRLHALRREAPLFDTPRFVRHLERAYRAMWHRRSEHEAEPIVVEPTGH